MALALHCIQLKTLPLRSAPQPLTNFGRCSFFNQHRKNSWSCRLILSMAPSKMNRCFNIPELVVEISLQCDMHTLATLGRTARLFDCALDALWSGYHDQVGRMSLLRIIQFFTCEVDDTERLWLSSAIEPQEWDRFSFYAGRIKAFRLPISVFDPAFLASLVSHTPSGSILPNLKELLLEADVENELRHAHAFISPSLQILNIELLQQESIAGYILASLLDTITTVSLNITNLELRINSMIYFPELHTLLGHLRRLRRLALQFISAEHIPLIMSLPELTHLIIHHIADNKVALPISTCERDTLMFLHLSGSPEHIHALFRLLSKCPLESISLDIFELGDASAFAKIVRAVTDKCQPHSLCCIKIAEDLEKGFEIAREHLQPFLAFHNITHFEHAHLGPQYLDDSFISSLATSWPNLVHLELCLSNRFDSGILILTKRHLYTTRVTARSFALLAFHCPRLTFIGLEFDATIITPAMLKNFGDYLDDKEGSDATQGVCNRSVQRLSVGYSPIAEPAPVSEFVRSLFPNLTELDFYSPSSMEPAAREVHTKQWQSVWNALELEGTSCV